MPARAEPSKATGVAATFDGVQFRYGDLMALDRTTMTFERGTSVALVGANGSGKSTMLKLLAGLVTPTSGSVWRVNDAVAFVAQQHHHHQWLPIPVSEVLRMGCYRRRGLLGRITAADRREIADVAARLGVSELMSRPYGALSGGQRQRVLVAQSLIGPPDLLLLDEPITGLDIPSQETILRLVDEETAAVRPSCSPPTTWKRRSGPPGWCSSPAVSSPTDRRPRSSVRST